MSTALEVASAYADLGWRVVPVLPRGKAPGWNGRMQAGWQHLQLEPSDLAAYFAADSNVGVLLGEPSGHLIDVDLDCSEAIDLAPKFLPPSWCFGRTSKPRSHWLYLCEGAATEKFKAPAGDMLVEVRSTGSQTVFPGSIHTSGEPIEWTEDLDAAEEPTRAPAAALRKRVAKLAAAALVMRHAGRGPALEWIAGADCPALPGEVTEQIRRWWGLAAPPRRPVASSCQTRPTASIAHVATWPRCQVRSAGAADTRGPSSLRSGLFMGLSSTTGRPSSCSPSGARRAHHLGARPSWPTRLRRPANTERQSPGGCIWG